MRKFLLVAAAAACLLAVSQQKASAWSSFKCIVGVGVSWERSGCCCPYPPNCGPYGGGGFGPSTPPGFAMGGYDGMAYPAAAAAPAAAPTAPASTSAVKPASYQEYYYGAYQQTGYSYSAPYYFYGYGQAPSYWYGY